MQLQQQGFQLCSLVGIVGYPAELKLSYRAINKATCKMPAISRRDLAEC
jgi:hypothetical protein